MNDPLSEDIRDEIIRTIGLDADVKIVDEQGQEWYTLRPPSVVASTMISAAMLAGLGGNFLPGCWCGRGSRTIRDIPGCRCEAAPVKQYGKRSRRRDRHKRGKK